MNGMIRHKRSCFIAYNVFFFHFERRLVNIIQSTIIKDVLPSHPLSLMNMVDLLSWNIIERCVNIMKSLKYQIINNLNRNFINILFLFFFYSSLTFFPPMQMYFISDEFRFTEFNILTKIWNFRFLENSVV